MRRREFVLPGIVKLVMQQRDKRMGHNPATRGRVEIPARQVVKARIVKQLKDVVETWMRRKTAAAATPWIGIDVGALEHLRHGASNRARCDTSASSACSRFVDGLPERRPGDRLSGAPAPRSCRRGVRRRRLDARGPAVEPARGDASGRGSIERS